MSPSVRRPAAAALGALALQASPLDAQAPVLRFPSITATSLSGRQYALPQELDGDVNLVVVAFKRRQQGLVNGWLPAARALAAERPTLRFYEMPTIGRRFTLIRPIIQNGMRGGVTDPADREATITLYTNVAALRRALDIPSDDTIHALLLDREGVVRWRGAGAFTPAQGEALRRAVGALLDAPTPAR